MPAPDYTDKFNTQLSPEDEARYEAWAVANNRTGDTYDYDMRGAWKEMIAGGEGQSSNGHFTDKYKKPNHPTFSNESQYSGTAGNIGGVWSTAAGGKDVFTPSATNLRNMTPDELSQYFKKVEPDAILNLSPSGFANQMDPTMQGK